MNLNLPVLSGRQEGIVHSSSPPPPSPQTSLQRRPTGVRLLHEPHSCLNDTVVKKKNKTKRERGVGGGGPSGDSGDGRTAAFVSACTNMKRKIKRQPAQQGNTAAGSTPRWRLSKMLTRALGLCDKGILKCVHVCARVCVSVCSVQHPSLSFLRTNWFRLKLSV